MIEAIIGIVGTILGTFMGWFLNSMSQAGKLNIFINSWKDTFQFNDEHGCMAPSFCVEQTQYYNYTLDIDLYNSSGEMKIMRNIEVVFSDGCSDIRVTIPQDEATKRLSSGMILYDDVEPINIPPKAVIKYKLSKGFNNQNQGLNFLWHTTKVNLHYADEKGKTRTVPIKSEIYKDYFEIHKQEDETDA